MVDHLSRGAQLGAFAATLVFAALFVAIAIAGARGVFDRWSDLRLTIVGIPVAAYFLAYAWAAWIVVGSATLN